jgi:hypothetical protein
VSLAHFLFDTHLFSPTLAALCLSVALASPVPAQEGPPSPHAPTAWSLVSYYPHGDPHMGPAVVFTVTAPCAAGIDAVALALRSAGSPPLPPTQPCAPVVRRITPQGDLPAWAAPYEQVDESRTAVDGAVLPVTQE